MAHYNRPPAAEYLAGVVPCIAGSGGVVAGTFVSISDGVATTATSGHAFLCMDTADEGDPCGVKIYGVGLLKVNAQSNNLSGGSKIKPTTAGVGVLAGTNKDAYSALSLGTSTTDGDYIQVAVDHGVANI